MSADEPFAPGTLIDGRFELRERLGSGGFGDVYRAAQLLFGRPVREVALKLFKQRHIDADNAAQVFADAITLLGLLEDDPPAEVARRMVQVYDLGVTAGPQARGYIAMRLVPGRRSLAGELRRYAGRGMPVETASWYLRRLLVPLAWLHRQDAPLVHGDLKPDNVLLAPDGDLVLTDFGLAARLPLGATGGTIPYEAPELLLRGQGTPTSDIYSLGVIWYEMLAGRHPFADVGLAELATGDDLAYRRAHHAARKQGWRPAGAGADAGEALAPPSDFSPALSRHPQIEALLLRCLAYRSSQRFANAGLLLAELERYAADGTVSPQALETPPAPPTQAPVGKTAAARVQDALAWLARGGAEQALGLVQELLRSEPRFTPAIVVQAQALVALERVGEARELIGRAYAAAPNDPGLLDAYADVMEAGGQTGTAQALRRQAAGLRTKGAAAGAAPVRR